MVGSLIEGRRWRRACRMSTPTEVAMQSRRQFILKGAKLVAVGAAAASARPSVFVRGAGAADKQLKVLQWAHFVAAYRQWVDPWAKEWGAKRGVEVTVDHVGFADVVPRATAEVAAQSGHDVHMFIGLASAFEEHVIDLKEVSGTLEKNTAGRSSWPPAAPTTRTPRSSSRCPTCG